MAEQTRMKYVSYAHKIHCREEERRVCTSGPFMLVFMHLFTVCYGYAFNFVLLQFYIHA